MRTTITLEPDVEELVRQSMRARRLTFKAPVNEAIRAGLAPTATTPFRAPVFDLGAATVPLDQALRLAGELEDGDTARELAAGR